MGLLRGLMGHATEIDVDKIQQEFEPILADGEEIEVAFKLIRDMLIFTNTRLIMVDKEGITGKRQEFTSLPYRSIVRFSKQSKGILDLDAELKLWIFGQEQPIVKKFTKHENINGVYKTLSQALLS